MRVGIIGVGNMGSAFARRLSTSGHEVCIASRRFDEAKQVAASMGQWVHPIRQTELGDHSDVVIAATPYSSQVAALRASGDLRGKVIVEISNLFQPDVSGLAAGAVISGAEAVAKEFPGASVVKAFNTVFAQVLGSEPNGSSRVQVFYAGDDGSAKKIVRSLIESMGLEPVDTGPLHNARYLEALGILTVFFGYHAGLGTDIALNVQRVEAHAAA